MATSDESVKIVPNTNFVVDGFRLKDKQKYQDYFLTHFHADHYTGITKTWKHGTIYCSPATCNLIQFKLKVDAKYITSLELNKKHLIKGVNVTLFDANHCPGSVVILFELTNGETYLHTGDFRFDSSLLTHSLLQKYLPRFRHEISSEEEIDESSCVKTVHKTGSKYTPFCKVFVKNQPRITAAYLDTTYCHPTHVFPKQVDVIEVVAKAVQQKLKQQPDTLFIIGTYQIGKERICARIAELLHCKVFVNWQKYQMMKCLHLPYQHIFTTNINEAGPIHVVPMFDLGWKKLFDLRTSIQNKYKEIVAIKPTGWTFTSLSKDEHSAEKDLDDSQVLVEDEDDAEKLFFAEEEEDQTSNLDVNDSTKQVYNVKVDKRSNITVLNVPYSEHSAFYELREFVENVQPKQIVPTVYSNQGHKSKQLYFLSDKFNYDYTAIRNTVSVPDEFFEDAAKSSMKKKESAKPKKEEPKKEEKGSILNFFKKSITKVTNLFSTKGAQEIQQTKTVITSSTLLHVNNPPSSSLDNAPTTPSSHKSLSPSASVIIELDSSQDSNDSNTTNNTSSVNLSLDSSFASSQAPLEEDSIDLGSIDVGLQRHILLTLEREKDKKSTPKSNSSTSTTPSHQSIKKRQRTETPTTSSAASKKKKTEVESKNSILSFFKKPS